MFPGRRRPDGPGPGRWVAAALLTGLLADDLALRVRMARRESDLERLRAELAALRRQGDEIAARLRAEARTDPLTGLGNRRRWQEQLAHEMERGRRAGTTAAVAVVDLDRFKVVNDTLGHAAGDALLREVATHFASVVRRVDMVARVGGEEFALLLPDAPAADAVPVIERLRTGMPPGVTGSFGVAVWDGQESGDELWHRADAAMYRAKAAGGDRLVVA